MTALEAPAGRYEARRARARQEAAERRLDDLEAQESAHALLAWADSLDHEQRTFARFFREEVQGS